MNFKKFFKNSAIFLSCVTAVASLNINSLSISAEETLSPDKFFSMIKSEPQEIAEQQNGLAGDIDGNGQIDSNDITEIKNILFGYAESSIQSDVNSDGKTDTYDLILLKNIVLFKDTQSDKKIICLDAGHYGLYNQSPGVSAYYESNMTWKLHVYLKSALESYGFEVITTRENQQTDCGLVTRGQMSAGCNLFLSIHSNAVGSYMNENTDFPVAIVLLPDDNTDIDEISMQIGQRLTNTVAETMQTNQKGSVWTRLSDEDRNGDEILNDEWYGVMFGAKSVGTPAILMEHSFHTNTRSANWLLIDSNLQNLADAEALTIAEYFGLA